MNNPDYTFLSLHYEAVQEYLGLLDWELHNDPLNGYFYVINTDEANRCNLSKKETAILLALRMIYEDNQDQLGLEQDAFCTVRDVLEKVVTDYAILPAKPNMEEGEAGADPAGKPCHHSARGRKVQSGQLQICDSADDSDRRIRREAEYRCIRTGKRRTLMKKLKKILLINWLYFSKELIEVGNVNFLTGKNGAGKSTVIDALQIVLLGETNSRNFNQAANEKSQRTLDGYLRADMDENNPYSRRGKDFSSYIACEFQG